MSSDLSCFYCPPKTFELALWVSQNLKPSPCSLGFGEMEPWVRWSFLAVVGVEPKLPEIQKVL